MVRARLTRSFAGFRRAPVAYMQKYGINVAGFFWNAGTALLYVFGAIELSPRVIVSAVFNTLSPTTYLLFGQYNAGVLVGSACGIIGTFLSVYPEIMRGEPAAVFGFIAFCAFVSLNIFSLPLTIKFEHSHKRWQRETLGYPRRLAGLGPFFFTRMPIIWETIADKNWQTASVFIVWGFGDIALSFSKVDTSRRKHGLARDLTRP